MGIILVVVGHLWRWPPGVYAMLDMFFVLSGFLITAILVKALGKYGLRFLLVFALSRVRRLMPAAVTVVLATVGATYLIYSSARGDQVAEDGMWALLLVVNWHFARNGTDYFQDDRTGSPLVHYWSLSIEEQFYAVWPIVILLLLLAAARGKRLGTTAVLGLGIGAVTAAAFAYSLWHSVNAPTAAYFSTLDRAWEFGIGGLLAVFAPHLARLPRPSAVALSWGGTLGLLVTLYFLPYGVPFPAPYGLFPSLLTGAIIVGGLDRDTSYIPLLDNRLMIYLGDLSYSIYLCHLPVNIMLVPFFADGAAAYFVAAIAGTALASGVCYYLVERPLREARWLMTRPERRRQRRAGRRTNWTTVRYGWLTVFVSAVLALSAVATLRPSAHPSGATPTATVEDPAPAVDTRTEAEQAQALAVARAVASADFPAFDPPLADLTFPRWSDELESANVCVDVTDANFDDCHFGAAAARREAVLIGDSFAMAWMPGIRDALVSEGWGLQQMTAQQCPTWTLRNGYVTAENRPNPNCAAQHTRAEQYVRRTRPDLVILTSAQYQVRNTERRDVPDDPVRVAQDGLEATLQALRPYADRVVVLGPPPTTGDLLTCVSRIAGPERCITEAEDAWDDHTEGELAAATAFGASYVGTEDWFCDEDGQCPAFIGDTPVLAAGHLTRRMSESLVPLLAEVLTPAPEGGTRANGER